MEATFRAMHEDWLRVKDQERAHLARWGHGIAVLLEEEARMRDAGQWIHGRDDCLGVLGRERDEVMHSRMIAWLLDPCARHGLGGRVLAGLLEDVFGWSSSPKGLERARTRCEVPLANGRLDVVVEAPGLYLVIENKVDAEEGDEQCAYYARHLDPAAKCILLSPDGRRSRDESCFRPLRYVKLAEILRRALAGGSNATPGRLVAESYLRTLTMEFQ